MRIPTTPHYVAFGRNVGISVPYSVSYSLDGVNWVPSTLPAGSGGLGKTAFGEDRFVAITDNNTNEAAYSIDGITWLPTTLPSAQSWTTVAYGGGKFVALAAGSNAAAYSTDGITWTATTLPASGSWLSVTYADGKFVAIARYSSTSAYSTNGITWNAGTLPSGLSWQEVAYGAGKFVALANGSSNFAYSTNGITWTIAFLPFSANWISLAYGDGKFVALVGNSSTSAYSLDGVSWTGSSMPSSRFWSSITYGGNKFVALASQSTTTAYSSDGINWSVSTMPVAAGWSSIAYGEFFQKTLSYSASSNGLWRDMVAPYVKVAGAWKVAKSAFIKVSGQWKKWFLQGGVIDYQVLSALGAGITGGVPGYIVLSIAVQPDKKIILGGSFGNQTTFNGTTMYRIARLNADYTLDMAFYANTGGGFAHSGGPGGYGDVVDLKVLPNGKILVIGNFGYFNPTYSGNIVFGGTTVNGIALLNSDGTLDTAFRSNTGTGFTFNSTANSSVVQTDGKLVIVGDFTALNGTTANRLVRLNSDGTRDTAFAANIGTGLNNAAYSIVLQSDGKLIIAGLFTQFNGTTVNGIVRLNSDGTLDTTFAANTGTGFQVTSGGGPIGAFTLGLQSDGKIVVGGYFTLFNGAAVNRLVRLNSDGTLDAAFSSAQGTGLNDWPTKLAIQSNGQIILTGLFTFFNGVSVPSFMRLNSNGTRDSAFTVNNNGGANTTVRVINVRDDGSLLLGGGFSSFGGVSVGKVVQIGGAIAY